MTRTRRLLPPTPAAPPARPWVRPGACLDCPNCRGLCFELLALYLVPECILHLREVAR